MAGEESRAAGFQARASFPTFSDLHPYLTWRAVFGNGISSMARRKLQKSRPSGVDQGRTSSASTELDVEQGDSAETVLYLAYGSNLSAETFLGKRGIKPISFQNVLVPELSLTFDLPGIPYTEPCFANTRRRHPPVAEHNASAPSEKAPLIASKGGSDYHKDRWKKGLVGVVYEVSKQDYATIIATEGGGAAYHDILVTCHALPDAPIVPEHPDTPTFKAHTLFAQPLESKPKTSGATDNDRLHRPDPSYAQPSARYLKLITDGAEEHHLPEEYKAYLFDIRPYTLTTTRQRLGQFIFMMTWMPVLSVIFGAGSLFSDDKGRSPPWLAEFSLAVFNAIWASYDEFFKKLFGDGERTVGQDSSDDKLPSRKVPSRQGINRDNEVQGGASFTEKSGSYATFPK